MKLSVTLEVEIEALSAVLTEQLLKLKVEHFPLTMMEHVVTRVGSVPSTEIRVSEVTVDGEPIEAIEPAA